MGDFSSTPDDELSAALEKGYTRVHIEQGVPLLDRDLNLLGDLPVAMVRALGSSFVGTGFDANAFKIEAGGSTPPNDLRIGGPGIAIVNGAQVHIVAPRLYSEQVPAPPALTPTTSVRTDVVFLDLEELPHEITDAEDGVLGNTSDVQLRTSVRRGDFKWAVRVVEGTSSLPAAEPGHVHRQLARLIRHGSALTIRDDRAVLPRLDELSAFPRIRDEVMDPNTGLAALQARVRELEERLNRSLEPLSAHRNMTGNVPWPITLTHKATHLIVIGYVKAGPSGDELTRQVVAMATRHESAVTHAGFQYRVERPNFEAINDALFVLRPSAGATEYARLAVDTWTDDSLIIRLSHTTPPAGTPEASLRALLL